MKDMNLGLMAVVNLGLINAFREWADTNGHRTYISVASHALGVVLPPNLDEITSLNIGSASVGYYFSDDSRLSFSTRFNGKSFDCVIPLYAIMSIHSPDVKSSQMGLSGLAEAMAVQGKIILSSMTQATPDTPKKPTGRPNLTVVK